MLIVFFLLLLAALAPCPAAGRSWKRREILFVTSYNGGYEDLGYLASFRLQQKKKTEKWRLDPVNWDIGCGPSPTSIFLDERRGRLYCLDEGLGAPNGTISGYRIVMDGDKITGRFARHGGRNLTPPGPVSAVTYGFSKNDKKRPYHRQPGLRSFNILEVITNTPDDYTTHEYYWLAVAHYSAGTLSGWSAPESRGGIDHQDSWDPITYKLNEPGPNLERQDASHPHQTILDPTEEFILVPDLGADMVHLYRSSRRPSEGGYLTPLGPLLVNAGCGPRHGAFVRNKVKVPKNELKEDMVYQNWQTFFHLVCELDNSIISYKVEYTKSHKVPSFRKEELKHIGYPGPGYGGWENKAEYIKFEQIGFQNTFGGADVPEGAAAAEILISPDKRFVVVSNRNDLTFADFRTPGTLFPNDTQTVVESDSLATFSIGENGQLKFEELAPAGGSVPRSFSFNRRGDLVAVALQYSKSVSILSRDVETGRIGPEVTRYDNLGNVTSVTFSQFEAVGLIPVPGGHAEAKMCIVKPKTNPQQCQIDNHWPDSFKWPEDWERLENYPAPGTSVIDKFPWVVWDGSRWAK